MTSAYYRGALGAMLVYDISKRHTFEHTARWVDELRAHADKSIVVMLIGNKSDLSVRAVTTDEAAAFAEEQGLFFSEASAFSGENVERAFLSLLQEIHANMSKKSLATPAKGREYGSNMLMLKGTKLSPSEEISLMETSAMKKSSSCSCS